MFITFPIGPVGLVCVQRTIKKGSKNGYVSALGAISSDFVYGLLVLFATNYIDEYIKKDGYIINFFLAIIFITLGVKIMLSKEKKEIEDDFVHPALSGFFLGILNPGTIFMYLGIFTYFPVKLGINNLSYTIKILFFIFLGSNLLWIIITELLSHLKKQTQYPLHKIYIIDKIIGFIIFLLSIIPLYKAIKFWRG